VYQLSNSESNTTKAFLINKIAYDGSETDQKAKAHRHVVTDQHQPVRKTDAQKTIHKQMTKLFVFIFIYST